MIYYYLFISRQTQRSPRQRKHIHILLYYSTGCHTVWVMIIIVVVVMVDVDVDEPCTILLSWIHFSISALRKIFHWSIEKRDRRARYRAENWHIPSESFQKHGKFMRCVDPKKSCVCRQCVAWFYHLSLTPGCDSDQISSSIVWLSVWGLGSHVSRLACS